MLLFSLRIATSRESKLRQVARTSLRRDASLYKDWQVPSRDVAASESVSAPFILSSVSLSLSLSLSPPLPLPLSLSLSPSFLPTFFFYLPFIWRLTHDARNRITASPTTEVARDDLLWRKTNFNQCRRRQKTFENGKTTRTTTTTTTTTTTATGCFTDLSHKCRRFPFAFKSFREISPELRVEKDWPVTRLAYDIFYAYRVISAYFLLHALISNEHRNFVDGNFFFFFCGFASRISHEYL